MAHEAMGGKDAKGGVPPRSSYGYDQEELEKDEDEVLSPLSKAWVGEAGGSRCPPHLCRSLSL